MRTLGDEGTPELKPTRKQLLMKDERGIVAVLATIALAVLLGCTALVIDIGRAFYVQRSLQASADAAALAGAQKLPSDDAIGLARAYSGRPGAKNARKDVDGVTTEVSLTCREGSPCRPVNAVVVTERVQLATDFAKVFGINSFSVGVRAVAQVRSGDVPWAIFAMDSQCDGFGFRYNGNVFEVEGGIHSNGEFSVNGMNIEAGYASSGGPNDCEPEVDGDHVDFGGGNEMPVRETELLPWPRPYSTADFSCTYRRAEFKFNKHNETIPPGVYCATKLFNINANHVKGNITVLAPKIEVDGNNIQLTPYANDLLFFGTGTQEMTLNGNSYDWTGTIFCERCRIKMNGNADSTYLGMLEGLEVEINGNAFRMTGWGPNTAGKVIELVE